MSTNVRNSLNSPLAQVTSFYYGGQWSNTPIQALVIGGQISSTSNGFILSHDLKLGYGFRNGFFQRDSEPPVSYPDRFINRIYQPIYNNRSYQTWISAGSNIVTNQINQGPTPSNLSLQGAPGPTFESNLDLYFSRIQALAPSGQLLDSEDLIKGRVLRIGRTGWYYVPPSDPPVSFPNTRIGRPYYPSLGGTNRYIDYNPIRNSNSPILTNQLFNGPTPEDLSLEGDQGPALEVDGDINSPLQAFVSNGILNDSKDLLVGSTLRYNFYQPPSNPLISFPDQYVGLPYYPSLGGTYKERGPANGRY